MMRRAHNCPRAQRGASLPLVLFLFLICAMAASIVLAAGTAAAGRVSELAQSDQLYYNATSSARLFRDELFADEGRTQGHAVTVMLSKEPAGSGAGAGSGSGAQASPVLTMLLDGAVVDGSADYSLLERAAFFALFGRDAKNGREAQEFVNASLTSAEWDTWLDDFSDSFPGTSFAAFKLTHSADGLSEDVRDALELNVKAEVDAEGNLVFKFLAADDGAQSDDDALLTLVCVGDYDIERMEMRDEPLAAGASSNSAAYDVQAVTITWTPSSLEKG